MGTASRDLAICSTVHAAGYATRLDAAILRSSKFVALAIGTGIVDAIGVIAERPREGS